jgi:hypothetical protein
MRQGVTATSTKPAFIRGERRFHSNKCDTNPSASFGSNQVGLGGMTSPASATRVQPAKVHCANNGAWIEAGESAKAQAISPESTRRSSFFGCMDRTPISPTLLI